MSPTAAGNVPSRDPWASRPGRRGSQWTSKEEVIRVAGRYRALGIKLLGDRHRGASSCGSRQRGMGKDLLKQPAASTAKLPKAATRRIAASPSTALNGT